MPVPSSAKFDILDWNIRAADTVDFPNDAQLSDSVDPITTYAFATNNTVTADGFTTLVADARINSVDAVISSTIQISDELPAPVPENFTFEFDIYLPDGDESVSPPIRQVPLNFTDPDNRIFIGAINQQGYTAGFLFSYDGIALAAYPEDPQPTVLAGSKKFLFDDDGSFTDGVNIRAIIDGENGRIAIYIATSDAAYAFDPHITEAGIKYNLAAKKSTGVFNDSVYLQTRAPTKARLGEEFTHGETSIVTIGSLRLASYKVLPEDRPIADAYTAYQTVVGTSLPLVGSKSYDPTGKNLTYNWELDLYPDGSTATIQGATHSTSTLTIVDPDPLNPDPLPIVVITHKRPTKLSDAIKVVIEEGVKESILSMTWNSVTKVLAISLGADSDGNITTSAIDLVQAFSSQLSAGYDVEIAGGTTIIDFAQPATEDQDTTLETTEVTHEQLTYPGIFRADLAIVGSAGLEKIAPGTFTFTGGSGSALMNPVFIPDKPGVYVAYLVVNNGTRDSLPYRLVFSAGVTNQLLGHRPNSKYIWKYVSDFWNLVPDKTQITSIWSAMTQAVSSELVTAWQNDYAKAIKDVSRRYQRRWLHYDAKVSVPKGNTAKIVQPGSFNRLDLDVLDVAVGSSTNIATVVKESALAPFTVGKALLRTTLHPPAIVDIAGVTGLSGTMASMSSWQLTSAKDSFPSFEILAQRTGGYFVADPSLLTQTTPAKSVVFNDPTYPLTNKVDSSLDTIRVFDELGENPKLVRVAEIGPSQLTNTVKFVEGTGVGEIELQTVDGFAREWDHLREAKNVELEQTPYILFGDEFTLSDYVSLGLGDYVTLTVIDPYTSTEIDVSLSVLASSNQCVYVDWQPLLDALSAQSVIAGEGQAWVVEDLIDISIRPSAVVLARKLNQSQDLVSIPMLGTNSTDQDLVENLDFSITDNRVSLTDWFYGTVRTVAGTNRIFLDSPLIVHTSLSALYGYHGDLSFLGKDNRVENVQFICLGAGDSGVYLVTSYNDDGSITVDRPLTHDADKLYFWAPRYTAFTPIPDMLWAELSYFDNWKTVENNFGLFIGFPKELVDSYDPELDYLSVTKSIWFAFLSGPHFDNMQLAIQAMFDLPYSEVTGQIRHISEPTETQDGRFVVEDENGRSYTYSYPRNATIAINPATGEKYSSFQTPLYWDLVLEDGVYYQTVDGENVEVTAETLEAIEKAKVTAYSKLVDVVIIEDYVSNPDLIARQFGGNTTTYLDELGNTHIVDQEPTEIEKYHKFVVDVPMDVTQTTQVFPLVKLFLEEAKPAHTDFILVGSLKLSDEISCIDSIDVNPTLLLKDTPHSSPFWGLDDGIVTWENTVDAAENQNVIPEARQDLIWPKERTLAKGPGGFLPDNPDLLHPDFLTVNLLGIVTFPNTYCVGIDELAGGFSVDFDVGTQRYKISLGPSSTYGEFVDPPQAVVPFVGFPYVAPHYEANATLTTIGGLWYIIGGGAIAPCIGFFFDNQFWLMDVVETSGSLHGTGINGAPLGVSREISVANAPFNLLNLEGNVDRIYLFGDTAANIGAAFPPDFTDFFMNKDDVLEKYDSGYCEGVLDDYSGDGSWNTKWTTLDMVNSLESDIDVVRSRIWVPVIKDVTAPQADLEFELGEPLSLRVTNIATTNVVSHETIWDDAPPIVLHVGAGVHPRIPAFDPASPASGIFSPQFEHPNTYLILGFDRSDMNDSHDWTERPSQKTYNAYGDETRLDVIKTAFTTFNPSNPATHTLSLVGERSGAVADISTVVGSGQGIPDRAHIWHVADPNTTTFLDFPVYPFFMLETVWQQDKLLEYGPVSDPSFTLTKYLPIDTGAGPYPNGSGGIFVDDWWQASPAFDSNWLYPGAQFGDTIVEIVGGDPATPPIITTLHPHKLDVSDTVHIWNTDQPTDSTPPGLTEKLNGSYVVAGITSNTIFTITIPPGGPTVESVGSGATTVGFIGHSPLHYEIVDKHQKELQMYPFNSDDADNEIYVPSNSYSIWGDVVAPTTTKLTWGYKDEGPLLDAGANAIDDFDQSASVTTYLQNIHYGLKIRSRKEYHVTHGFTEFFIPPPAIKILAPSTGASDIRICGFYFCNDDPTRVNIPTSTPGSYGDPTATEGIIGGSWVFFRHSVSEEEYPVTGYTFEQGVNPGNLVGLLGKNRIGASKYIFGSADQPSDGHIMEINIPAGITEVGHYDIIVRNYRPYQMKSGGAWQYHMDEAIAPKVFHRSAGGWEVTAWGLTPFGGV